MCHGTQCVSVGRCVEATVLALHQLMEGADYGIIVRTAWPPVAWGGRSSSAISCSTQWIHFGSQHQDASIFGMGVSRFLLVRTSRVLFMGWFTSLSSSHCPSPGSLRLRCPCRRLRYLTKGAVKRQRTEELAILRPGLSDGWRLLQCHLQSVSLAFHLDPSSPCR